MASINDLSLAKGLTAKVEDACAGMTPHDAAVQRRDLGLNAITSRLLDTQRLRWRRE